MISRNGLDQLLNSPPYGLNQADKRSILTARVRELTHSHYERCEPYRNIVNRLFAGTRALHFEKLEDAPFLPVSLFKRRELRSVPREQVVKTLTSSGTTGQTVSRIYLDAATTQLQTRTLVKIMQHFLGVDRRPMIFLDHPTVVRDRQFFSARGAGILGLLPFGRRPIYALRDDMSLDLEGLQAYIASTNHTPPVLFGFTFMVWRYFVCELEKLNQTVPLSGSILLHSGGWKKLEALRVSHAEFRTRVKNVTGIDQVINYYGMVEHVGSVYMENPLHFLHAPIYSDVIIRDTHTLEPLPRGETGIIQVVSALPESYPGHSLLTEDLGVIEGCDNPETGMGGQYFRILSRLPKAELRGCSDTFQKPAALGANG
jgi:hypothetical protein